MLEELENLVKEATGSAVSNAPEVSNDQSGAIAQHVQGSILSELTSAVSGGGLSSIMGMFSGGNAGSSPAAQNILSNLTNSLASKFGLSAETASSLSSSIVPKVLDSLGSKLNDSSNAGVTESSITSALSGGGGLLDKLKSFI